MIEWMAMIHTYLAYTDLRMINGSQYGYSYWIGYTDMPPYGGGKGTMQYGWVTGCSSIYTNWAPGEPNHHCNNEDYVEAYNGQWNDHLPYHTNLCGCQLTSYTITDTPSSGPTVATSPRTSTAPSSDPTVVCPMPCDGSADLYNCTCSSVVPLNQVMRITDSPINQRVIWEEGGCSSSTNSTAADTEGIDSAFESSTINQQIQETIRRTQDFTRRYLDDERQCINSIKTKLNTTLAEQHDTKELLTKFMIDRQTDYVSAKEGLQNKLQNKLEDATVISTTEL